MFALFEAQFFPSKVTRKGPSPQRHYGELTDQLVP